VDSGLLITPRRGTTAPPAGSPARPARNPARLASLECRHQGPANATPTIVAADEHPGRWHPV